LHLEIGGKSARVLLSGLPAARAQMKPVLRTSAGDIARVRVLNGVNPRLDPFGLRGDELNEGDPELDLREGGIRLEGDTMTAWFDGKAAQWQPIGNFRELDVIVGPDGAEKERRPHVVRERNLDGVHPIRIARRFPLEQALTQFVFKQSLQLVHEDSLTFEFLHGLARDLHQTREMALVGAGPKGAAPLVVRDRGSPCRAFLYGEVDGEQYRLLLLLSDQEMKLPAAARE
jgi:hypothetical protein